VTHGVGALSAINGIAGAYSEHVPVILISGSLPLRAIQRGDLMHHTLADREKGNFSRMFAEVTAAQARLTPADAVAEIDRLILTAWRRKRPVYLELPSDIPYLEIEAPERPLLLEMIPSGQKSLKACAKMIQERLKAANSACVPTGSGCDSLRRRRAHHGDRRTISHTVATLNCAKGAIP
jgi:indolepyruvate decarboxylase